MAEHEHGFKVTDRRSSTATSSESAAPADVETPSPETAETPGTEASEQTTSTAPSSADDTAHAPQDAAGAPQDAAEAPQFDENMPLPEANLLTLIFSLYTHTQICLGMLPDPISQQAQKDLNQAKYNIDMLAMLQEKTAGNLTDEEKQTLENVLYEVRMAYVGANR